MIAMALACEPKLLIADEPTTALDVTIQAQILDLLRELVAERDTALILITHDLGVVAGMCERVNVMYAGTIVEEGTADQVFARPAPPVHARACCRASRASTPARQQKLHPIAGLAARHARAHRPAARSRRAAGSRRRPARAAPRARAARYRAAGSVPAPGRRRRVAHVTARRSSSMSRRRGDAGDRDAAARAGRAPDVVPDQVAGSSSTGTSATSRPSTA